jgi:hypothetical protein
LRARVERKEVEMVSDERETDEVGKEMEEEDEDEDEERSALRS